MVGNMYKRIVVRRLSTNFRDATEIVTSAIPTHLKSTELMVRNHFVGINASDINLTSGRYLPDAIPPFDCGFEALGKVVAVGGNTEHFAVGDPVVTQSYGAFAEYQIVPSRCAKKVPSLRCEWLPLDLSGTTASISLAEVVKPLKGEVALVTAAGGGTGQFAVQLLKKVYGCVVIGVTSSPLKENLLRDLGCDHVLVDGQEPASRILKDFAPTGVNIAYESVGGRMLDVVLDNISLRGRILSLGSISGYADGSSWGGSHSLNASIPMRLLGKSASLHAFFLPHYVKYSRQHFTLLCQMYESGVLRSVVDSVRFKGLESVPDAIEHMYHRRNKGKVIVEI
uniref:Uncharacterized protein TCIL3000_10_8750 n=1 Tax=Trypanosoma congolense (strain IL3000) TaxID=1068625 RepID=G0UXI2_TRYCI|nr:unnamed protein product [Trypanosoma congolense IL3000]